MRPAVVILVLAAVELAAGPAAAQRRFTVQQLRELCAAAEVSRQNMCGAYITGVRQTMDVFKASLKRPDGEQFEF